MDPTKKDAVERLERIEMLLSQLRAETASSREEARVISESMAERSRRFQGISAFKKRSAEIRQNRTRRKNTPTR